MPRRKTSAIGWQLNSCSPPSDSEKPYRLTSNPDFLDFDFWLAHRTLLWSAKQMHSAGRGQLRRSPSLFTCIPPIHPWAPNLSAARAFALAASSSRFFGGAVVSSAFRRRIDSSAISSTALRNAASFAFDGLLNP